MIQVVMNNGKWRIKIFDEIFKAEDMNELKMIYGIYWT
jgi:hypothetical protein